MDIYSIELYCQLPRTKQKNINGFCEINWLHCMIITFSIKNYKFFLSSLLLTSLFDTIDLIEGKKVLLFGVIINRFYSLSYHTERTVAVSPVWSTQIVFIINNIFCICYFSTLANNFSKSFIHIFFSVILFIHVFIWFWSDDVINSWF